MIIYTKINSPRPPMVGDMVYSPHTKTIKIIEASINELLLAGDVLVYWSGSKYFVNNFQYNNSHLANSFLKYNDQFVYVIDRKLSAND